jgi:hypothetical protein
VDLFAAQARSESAAPPAVQPDVTSPPHVATLQRGIPPHPLAPATLAAAVVASGPMDERHEEVTPSPSRRVLGAMRNEAAVWLDAVNLQEERIVSDSQMNRRMIDARQFVPVLRLFYRARMEVGKLAKSPEIVAGIERFDSTVPARYIRDVIEHFEDYMHGVGRLGRGVRMPIHSYTTGTSTHIVQVPEFSEGMLVKMYTLDVAVAAKAARELALVVIE